MQGGHGWHRGAPLRLHRLRWGKIELGLQSASVPIAQTWKNRRTAYGNGAEMDCCAANVPGGRLRGRVGRRGPTDPAGRPSFLGRPTGRLTLGCSAGAGCFLGRPGLRLISDTLASAFTAIGGTSSRGTALPLPLPLSMTSTATIVPSALASCARSGICTDSSVLDKFGDPAWSMSVTHYSLHGRHR